MDDKIIKKVSDVNIGEDIIIKISDGEINATVLNTKRRNNNVKKGS